ncbi:DUF3048 domain-containing protein [Crassaminicella thermophila]|uniref:DUF3048 domain-containing protein n=1 Tax=Crassaminicella thermophila TaxID=2599308 RepID=A0A5C0SG53_CRATE|nr:DUF3048 domain-containing protein [Crassaminicella thermophila]QEK12354.1 DUF3048 domain-containing protein [Crassaminicella thermophila]
MVRNCKLIMFILTIFMATFFVGGCIKKEKPVVLEQESKIITNNQDDNKEILDNEETKIKEIKSKGVQSPISGIYTQKENINKRPFAVMLDNQIKARPQAGLDQAEIVYEILAEGWITRYMAVFLINEPKLIGPVRSARPYFIDKAMEFDALYVHDGGSPQALKDIKNLRIADISAQSRGKDIFWRKNHKSRPHNEYTSAAAVRKAAKQSHYKESANYQTLLFNKEDKTIHGNHLTYIQIPYSKNYKPNFRYKEKDNVYYRYINDKPHLDEVSKVHLTAKNIIIQKAKTKVIDSEGRREIALVGKGEGFFITGGEIRKITWEKKSRRAITKFFYEDGEEIRLNPGVTWIEVIPSNFELIME